jgi:hypothetical protein
MLCFFFKMEKCPQFCQFDVVDSRAWKHLETREWVVNQDLIVSLFDFLHSGGDPKLCEKSKNRHLTTTVGESRHAGTRT